MAGALSKSIRLSPALMAEAKRKGSINKRTAPKQIEFWAELGKIVELVMDPSDVLAVIQGFKKIKVEPVESATVDPGAVFHSLEQRRKSGELAGNVTSSAIYFEASRKMPGLIDRVDSATGERQTGQFHDGEFIIQA